MSSIAPNLSQPVGNPHPSAGKLVNRVARITARRIVIALIQAVLWGITALVLLTLCVAWMDIIWQLDVTVRFYALPTVVVVAVVVLCLKAWSEIRSATPISTAKRMDQVGRTGGQILSGFELCRSTSQHAIASPQQALTVGMSGVAIDQARHRAASIDARDVAPWALLKQSLLLAVTAVAIAGLFLFSAPKAFATSWERLTNPTADTPPYSPLTFIVDPGDTTLTYGQSLEVQVEIIGGAVDAAELIISKSDQGDAQRDEQRIAMYPRDRGHWQAVVPRVKEPMRYHVTANRGRSDIYQVDVLAVPKITAIRHTTTFPEYTRLPIRQGQSPQDRVEGLFGSTVDIVIRSDRPLAGGELRVAAAGENQSESKAVTLSVGDDPDMVHGTTSIDGSAIWTVRVRGTNDVWSDEALPIEVEMLMDRPPVVRVAQPQKRSYATPNTQIPVAVVAEDDYGISRLKLYRILNGSRPAPLDMPVETAARVAQGSWTFALDRMGLAPGDRISLFARVEDTRPQRIQWGESDLAEIEIISQADYDRLIAARQGQEMLEQKFRQAGRMLDQLESQAADLQKEMESADPNDKQQQERLQKQLQDLQQQMRDVAEKLDALAEQKLPLEIDPQWNKLLKEHAETLRKGAEAAEQLAKTGKPNGEQLDQLRKTIDQTRRKQQQQVDQPMDQLRKIMPIIAAESVYVQLVARQRILVEQLEPLRQVESVADAADRKLIVQLREEESKIRQELQELLSEIERLAVRLGDDPELQSLKESSNKFVQDVRASAIDSELSEAKTALGLYSANTGYDHALTALAEMERFLKQCQNCQNEGKQCLKKAFQPSLPGNGNSNNAIDNLLSQMGLNSGPSSGYSMRGNSGQNVGLYGNRPFAQPSGRGQGDDGRLMPSGGNSLERYSANTNGTPDQVDFSESNLGSPGDVPLRYQRQAEEYLQRLAEGESQ